VDVYELYLTNDNADEDIVVSKTEKHLFEFTTLMHGERDSGLDLIEEEDQGMPMAFTQRLGITDVELAGYLLQDTLPIIAASISLMDESENLLGLAVTDDSGKFSFDENLLEGDYKLILNDTQTKELRESDIYLAKNPKDMVFYLDDTRSGVFAFKKLAQRKPMTLYSLKDEAESGQIVNEKVTKLRGKFQYSKLPKSGVTLTLVDDKENVVERTKVNDDGTFQFEQYTSEKNYFIAA